MRLRSCLVGLFALAASALVAGCEGPRPIRRTPLPPIPRHMAERIVNDNADRIAGTLRAMGSVTGSVLDAEGVRRSFSLDGIMFYLRPDYLRFDLKKLGTRQALLGSNATGYWVYSKQDDAYRCGAHGEIDDLPPEFPIEPKQLLDALGLGGIADDANHLGRVQRIDDETQQILFLARDRDGETVVEKEYWLDRYPPRLVRKVIFRDDTGALEMTSVLSDYRALDGNGPLLPMQIDATWPRAGMELTFAVSKWTSYPQLGPDARQFAAPDECGDQLP